MQSDELFLLGLFVHMEGESEPKLKEKKIDIAFNPVWSQARFRTRE